MDPLTTARCFSGLWSRGSPGSGSSYPRRQHRSSRKSLNTSTVSCKLAQAAHNIPQTIAMLNLKAMASMQWKRYPSGRDAVKRILAACPARRPGSGLLWCRARRCAACSDCLDRNELSGSHVDAIISALSNEKDRSLWYGGPIRRRRHPLLPQRRTWQHP